MWMYYLVFLLLDFLLDWDSLLVYLHITLQDDMIFDLYNLVDQTISEEGIVF